MIEVAAALLVHRGAAVFSRPDIPFLVKEILGIFGSRPTEFRAEPPAESAIEPQSCRPEWRLGTCTPVLAAVFAPGSSKWTLTPAKSKRKAEKYRCKGSLFRFWPHSWSVLER